MKFLSDMKDKGPSLETRHKFGKMIVGSIAGFVASRYAENLYDSVIQHHEGKIKVTQE
jgi:hypothetical protein